KPTPLAPPRLAPRPPWADVLASIEDGVIVLDHAGRITDLNPAAEQLTGIAASQAAGGEVGTLFHTSPWVDEMARGTLVEGAAQLLRGALSDPELVRCTDIIIREVERLDGLVEQLRELSTAPRLRLEAVNIHRVLNDVVALQRQSPAWGGVALRSAFDPSLP